MKKFEQSGQRFIVLTLVLTVGVLLAACQSSTPTSQPPRDTATEAATQDAGETMTEAPAAPEGPVIVTVLTPAETTTAQDQVAKDVTLDPAQMQDDDSKVIGGYVFEPLVGLDKGSPVAWLANSWTVAEDGLAYTFVLTNDTYFSDGTPAATCVAGGGKVHDALRSRRLLAGASTHHVGHDVSAYWRIPGTNRTASIVGSRRHANASLSSTISISAGKAVSCVVFDSKHRRIEIPANDVSGRVRRVESRLCPAFRL